MQHAAQHREHREPEQHQQRDADQERKLVALEHDGAPEQSGAGGDGDDQHVAPSESDDHRGDGRWAQCPGEGAGDGVGGDDGGQGGESEQADCRQHRGTDEFTDRAGAEVEHHRGQRIGQRPHLAERVRRLDRQDRRARSALRRVIEQQKGVLEEPGTDDQDDGHPEGQRVHAERQQQREDADEQQGCHLQRQQQRAEYCAGIHFAE